jgi:hypothetical protein
MAWHVPVGVSLALWRVHADELLVSRLSVVPDGAPFFEEPETTGLKYVHQFAEPQGDIDPSLVYRRGGECPITSSTFRSRPIDTCRNNA